MATLSDIRTKIRKLTRSPSPSQLSDDAINTYINDFVLYDFPEHLRLLSFRKVLTFYTQPYVDIYDTNTIRNTDPLFNFKNVYITQHPPVYIAGVKASTSLCREEFYNSYPATSMETRIAGGNGITTFFSGTLSHVPVLQNHVNFTSVDANYDGLMLADKPLIEPVTGVRQVLGELFWPNSTTAVGSINYVTGDYSFTFPAAPLNGTDIYANTVPYQASTPTSVLYFGNTFYLRPVPDKVYRVDVETYVRPSELNATNQYPELEQYWKFIALGAARQILIDRLDTETLVTIDPEYEEQKLLCLRRSIVQQSDQRTATIYSRGVKNAGL